MAGLTKQEIRQLAERTGMDFPDQRALPCMLTRFAYRLRPTPETLKALDKAEETIEKILLDWTKDTPEAVLPDFRLRHLSRDVIELHLTPIPQRAGARAEDTVRSVPADLSRRLEEAVAQTTGRSLSAIKIMPKLSGYFDQE